MAKDTSNHIVLSAPEAELGTTIAVGTSTATTATSTEDTPPPTCTDFTYSDWAACSDSNQTRTVVTSSPDGCTGGSTDILSQSCSMIPTAGLTNYWSFDDAGSGTALDSVGGVNGTIHGTTATIDVKGAADKAYSFDGTDDYISMADPVNSVTQTLSFWFYPKVSSGGWRMMFFQWYRYIGMENGALSYYGDAGDFSLGSPSLNQWHHLVLTSNGTTATAYLDGSFISSHAAASGIIQIDPYDGMVFGDYQPYDQGIFYFNGSLDQIRIYSRALTGPSINCSDEPNNEVCYIFNAEKP